MTMPPFATEPPELAHILLFRTDIRTKKARRSLHLLLDGLPIEKWTLDAEDRDCVLRIVSDVLRPDEIIALITRNGFCCTELS